MRLYITHTITCDFEPDARSVAGVLRLTPRSYTGQFVRDWHLEMTEDSVLKPIEDAFGNVMHSIYFEGPLATFSVTAMGEVETEDRNGLVVAGAERMPTALFLRESRLTKPSHDICAFAADVRTSLSASPDTIELLHAANTAVHKHLSNETNASDADNDGVDAASSFATESASSAGRTHVLLAILRDMNIPARFVSGYVFDEDNGQPTLSGHSWAEAHVDGFGWLGFDPTFNLSPTDAYVRLAIGIDQADAAPIRSAQLGASSVELSTKIVVSNLDHL